MNNSGPTVAQKNNVNQTSIVPSTALTDGKTSLATMPTMDSILNQNPPTILLPQLLSIQKQSSKVKKRKLSKENYCYKYNSPDHQVVNMGRKLQVNNLINLSFVWSIYSASAGQKICLVIDDGFLINRRGKS